MKCIYVSKKTTFSSLPGSPVVCFLHPRLSSYLDDITESVFRSELNPFSITLPLHVSKKLPVASLILHSPSIGDAKRPSRGAKCGSVPIRVLCRKWTPLPFLPLGCAAVSRGPSRWTPSSSPARCLLKPPSYWLLEAAATRAEKKTLTMKKNGFSQPLKRHLDV